MWKLYTQKGLGVFLRFKFREGYSLDSLFYKEAYDAGSQSCLLDPYNETYRENMIYYNEALNNANK